MIHQDATTSLLTSNVSQLAGSQTIEAECVLAIAREVTVANNCLSEHQLHRVSHGSNARGESSQASQADCSGFTEKMSQCLIDAFTALTSIINSGKASNASTQAYRGALAALLFDMQLFGLNVSALKELEQPIENTTNDTMLTGLKELKQRVQYKTIDAIPIQISRVNGEMKQMQVHSNSVVGELRKSLCHEWNLCLSSLQLCVDDRVLRDWDVIGQCLNPSHNVVFSCVSTKESPPSDKVKSVRASLERLSDIMHPVQHAQLLHREKESCLCAEQSCTYAVAALEILSDCKYPDRATREMVKEAKRNLRNMILQRVEGWQLQEVSTRRIDEFDNIFDRLLHNTNCAKNTKSQLNNGIRKVSDIRQALYFQDARR